MAREKIAITPKFNIDDKVMVPVSDVPATVTAISMRRRPYQGYHSDNEIFVYYTVSVQFRVLGQAAFTTLTTEYYESELKKAA